MARVVRLDHIALQVASLEVVRDFYERLWGMHSERGPQGHFYLSCPAQSYAELVLQPGETSTLAYLSFAVARRDDVDEFAKLAPQQGYVVTHQPTNFSAPAQGRSMVLHDPDGNNVIIAWYAVPRLRATGDQSPSHLGHVVLWTPDPGRMEAFYGWLGFQVSDRTVRGMSFLRCNGDHHTLALVKGNRTGLQHIAFDGHDLDHVMQTYGKLKAAGVPCIWGPGRHGPGSNIFTYYKDPAGNVIELYSDLEQVEESDAPITEKFWGPEHKGDVWGSAGPVPPEFMS